MFLFLNTYSMPINCTIQLTTHLKVKVTATTISETLQNHPNYPSLLSIGDSLKHWQIDNVILKTTPEKLKELPTPFIAHTKQNNYLTIFEITNNNIVYQNETGGVKD